MPGGGLPSIEDQGRDGYPFAHIDFVSEPGAWEAILPFCLNIRILPDMDAKRPLDANEGNGDPIAAVPAPVVATPFHGPPSEPKGQHDHA